MIKLLVVDDEIWIRERISRKYHGNLYRRKW